jgi:ankyrin repeat protein
VATVAALLKHRADPAVVDEFGCTPLHKAASWGQHAALQLLLDHNLGAASPRRKPVDPNLRTSPTSCAPETRAVSLFEVRRTPRLLQALG